MKVFNIFFDYLITNCIDTNPVISEENLDLESDADKIVKESSEYLKQEQDAKSGSANKTPEEKISANSSKTTESTDMSKTIQNTNPISSKKHIDNKSVPSFYSAIIETPETPDVNLDKDSVRKFFEETTDVVDASKKKMEEITQDNKAIGEMSRKIILTQIYLTKHQ